jgi:excisionase family DNA binding protein
VTLSALLSPADVARLAAISRKTVYREIDRGELRAI